MSGIMSMVLGAKTAIAAAVDAYFNLVTLLLPGDGTNGAQNNTFLDSSTNNFTITRNGNTTQGTFSPFSQTGWSNYFGGGTNYLTVPDSTDLQFGTGDFTISAWIYLNSTSSEQSICAKGSSNTGWAFNINSSGKLMWLDTTSVNTAATTLATNTWNYVVASRVGSTVRLFLNGVQDLSVTLSTNYNQTSIFNIALSRDGSWPLNGYLSNLKVVKGSGVSSVTVPSSPETSTTGTSLLTCQSNRFVDTNTQVAAKTITVNGSPSVQAFSPFAPTAAYSAATNGGSGYFDGTGDYLSVGTAADWTFLHNTTAAWTMEFWVYNTTTGSATTLLDTNASTTGSTGVTVQKTASEFINVFITYSSAGNNIVNGTSNITLKANAWNHVFISYNQSLANTNLVFYINGAAAGTANKTANTPSSGNPANALSIATYGAGAGQFFPGYIGSLRISNTVRSTPSSVPTSPYTSDANTKLLANFTNAGITDATAKNVLETVGNAQISTTQSKFGGSSMYFDGTGDWLQQPISENANIANGDFTIEAWIYPTAVSGATRTIVSTYTNGYIFYINSSAQLQFDKYGVSTPITGSGTISANTWTHVAITRSGNTFRIFINGTQDASATSSTTFSNTSPLRVGDSGSGSQTFTGYIDDLRITKGYARYTASFTAPTAAFALQ